MEYLRSLLQGNSSDSQELANDDTSRNHMLELIASDDPYKNFIHDLRLITLQTSGRHRLSGTETYQLERFGESQWQNLEDAQKSKYYELAKNSLMTRFLLASQESVDSTEPGALIEPAEAGEPAAPRRRATKRHRSVSGEDSAPRRRAAQRERSTSVENAAGKRRAVQRERSASGANAEEGRRRAAQRPRSASGEPSAHKSLIALKKKGSARTPSAKRRRDRSTSGCTAPKRRRIAQEEPTAPRMRAATRDRAATTVRATPRSRAAPIAQARRTRRPKPPKSQKRKRSK